MFEAVQFVERVGESEPSESVVGEYGTKAVAVDAARVAREEFVATGSVDYAWWIVREQGARLATFIADNKSNKEFVLDLTSGQLVELPT